MNSTYEVMSDSNLGWPIIGIPISDSPLLEFQLGMARIKIPTTVNIYNDLCLVGCLCGE